MPASVPLARHQVIQAHATARELVVPEDVSTVIDTWTAARETGSGKGAVRLKSQPDQEVTRRAATSRPSRTSKTRSWRFQKSKCRGSLLRALKGAGIDLKDVQLVPLTRVQFVTALQARQVDVGVVRQASVYDHLHQYAQDGPRSVETNVVDLLTLGWAPGRVLTDRAKFAAIAVYLPIQARSSVWEYENPKICL